jgi:hypothetical protein
MPKEILNYAHEKLLNWKTTGLFMSKSNYSASIKDDFSGLFNGRTEINIDIFLHPEKYTVCLPVEKIVADHKVSRKGIEFYKQKIAANELVNAIIVVKHPKKDLYAVLDGHHRYYAYLESGRKQIDCALAGNYSSVIFYLTEHGYFQPSPQLTEGLRQPAIRLHKNLKQFLNNFINTFV